MKQEYDKRKITIKHDIKDVDFECYQNYSKALINENGTYNVMSIGFNPQREADDSNSNSFNSESRIFLEPTRYRAIQKFSKFVNGYSNIKHFIQADLFTDATKNAKDLVQEKAQKNNLYIIKKCIEQSDYVLLAWGDNVRWNIYKDIYLTNSNSKKISFKDILKDNIDKLYYLKLLKSGQPHSVLYVKEQLNKLTFNDLKEMTKIM